MNRDTTHECTPRMLQGYAIHPTHYAWGLLVDRVTHALAPLRRSQPHASHYTSTIVLNTSFAPLPLHLNTTNSTEHSATRVSPTHATFTYHHAQHTCSRVVIVEDNQCTLLRCKWTAFMVGSAGKGGLTSQRARNSQQLASFICISRVTFSLIAFRDW